MVEIASIPVNQEIVQVGDVIGHLVLDINFIW